jgi:hypothetical protein
MSQFDIGNYVGTGKEFLVPDDLVTQPVAIYGKRGSGKTNTAVVLVEEMVKAGQQTIVLEPLGNWTGLKSSADGTKKGLPVVILGGVDNDLPLDPSSGEVVADFIVAHRLSCVLSTSDFESGAEMRRFVTAFCRRFYHLKRKPENRTPVSLVIEEAHTYAPQRVGPDETKMLSAIQALMRTGRNFGIGVILIDQRPASINKDVSSQAEVLICHQVTGSHDRAAVDDWVKMYDEGDRRREFLTTVGRLGRGEAWVYSPDWLGVFDRVQIRARETFDSSATPKAGEAPRVPTVRQSVDLDLLRTAMAAQVEVFKANDPEILKAEIKTLKAKLASKAPAVDEAALRQEIQRTEQGRLRRIQAGHRKFSENALSTARKLRDEVNQILDQLEEMLRTEAEAPLVDPELPPTRVPLTAEEICRDFDRLENTDDDALTSVGEHYNQMTAPSVTLDEAADRYHQTRGTTRNELTPSELAVLDAVASIQGGATRKRVAVFARRSFKSSSFQSAFPSLVDKFLLTSSGETYEVTTTGRRLAQPMTAPSLRDWLRKLKPAQAKVLQAIADSYPNRVTRHDVAEASGQSEASSSFQGAFPSFATSR